MVKTKSGQLAAQSDLLVLQTRELKKLFPKEVKQIENLGVKVNKTTQYSTTVVETKTNVITTLRDSLIFDTVQVRVFDYQDQWYQIHGISEKDTQRLVIKSMDTLTQVLFYGERQKPWLWFFSPRKLQQRVSVTNPNATIKYSQTIQIQKPWTNLSLELRQQLPCMPSQRRRVLLLEPTPPTRAIRLWPLPKKQPVQ